MTRQEAAKMLNRLLLYCECPHGDCEKCVEAINMAEDALEKQSPCDICENEKEDWWVTCQFCPAEPKGGAER